MNAAFDLDGLRDALRSWAGKWLAHHRPDCDWCGHKLLEVDEYIEWCLTLREAWPAQARRLPKDKVFCAKCAVGAINELHGGPKFVPEYQEICPF